MRASRQRIISVLCAAAASAAIAGCGSGTARKAAAASTGQASTSTTSRVASSSRAASSLKASGGLIVPGQPASGTGEPVAYIRGTPLAKSAYEHWLAVERASGVEKNSGHAALAFMITSSWVLGEAAARHLSVSEGEVSERLGPLEKKSFPKKGQLQSFLKRTKETIGDLRTRVEVELLVGLIKGEVEAKAKKGSETAAVSAFERSFKAHWKALTNCRPSYVMEDCRQYKGSGEPGLGHPEASASASGKASASGSSGTPSSSATASSSGEVYTKPGAFTIGSPAFADNGAIPARYTCEGSGESPPLRWSNVPKGASELVLFVIDDSSNGTTGGIRWVMAGIPATDGSVAAGRTPPGAIVGENSEGKAAYGAICPSKGHTDRIELVAYALKKPISLSPGFQPAVAEHDYGSTKDIVGEAAVSYATYTRP